LSTGIDIKSFAQHIGRVKADGRDGTRLIFPLIHVPGLRVYACLAEMSVSLMPMVAATSNFSLCKNEYS